MHLPLAPRCIVTYIRDLFVACLLVQRYAASQKREGFDVGSVAAYHFALKACSDQNDSPCLLQIRNELQLDSSDIYSLVLHLQQAVAIQSDSDGQLTVLAGGQGGGVIVDQGVLNFTDVIFNLVAFPRSSFDSPSNFLTTLLAYLPQARGDGVVTLDNTTFKVDCGVLGDLSDEEFLTQLNEEPKVEAQAQRDGGSVEIRIDDFEHVNFGDNVEITCDQGQTVEELVVISSEVNRSTDIWTIIGGLQGGDFLNLNLQDNISLKAPRNKILPALPITITSSPQVLNFLPMIEYPVQLNSNSPITFQQAGVFIPTQQPISECNLVTDACVAQAITPVETLSSDPCLILCMDTNLFVECTVVDSVLFLAEDALPRSGTDSFVSRKTDDGFVNTDEIYVDVGRIGPWCMSSCRLTCSDYLQRNSQLGGEVENSSGPEILVWVLSSVAVVLFVVLIVVLYFVFRKRCDRPHGGMKDIGGDQQAMLSYGTERSEGTRLSVNAQSNSDNGKQKGFQPSFVEGGSVHGRSTSHHTFEPGGDTTNDMMYKIHQLAREIQRKQLVIKEEIGRGAYGVVYRGQLFSQDVAVKVVMFEGNAAERNRQSALIEAAVSTSLKHPHLVHSYTYSIDRLVAIGQAQQESGGSMSIGFDVQNDDAQVYRLHLVQEYCDLGSLSAIIKQQRFLQPDSELPDFLKIVTIAKHVAKGMAYLHQNSIIHGDLKSTNLLLRSSHQSRVGFITKIADFGLAVRLPDSRNHLSGIFAGTPFYAAPEISREGRLSKKADVFSFAVILWELYNQVLVYRHPSKVEAESAWSNANNLDQSQEQPRRVVGQAVAHSKFPTFPMTCPLPYALLCALCLSPNPSDRPDFTMVEQALGGMKQQAMKGIMKPGTHNTGLSQQFAEDQSQISPQQVHTLILLLSRFRGNPSRIPGLVKDIICGKYVDLSLWTTISPAQLAPVPETPDNLERQFNLDSPKLTDTARQVVSQKKVDSRPAVASVQNDAQSSKSSGSHQLSRHSFTPGVGSKEQALEEGSGRSQGKSEGVETGDQGMTKGGRGGMGSVGSSKQSGTSLKGSGGLSMTSEGQSGVSAPFNGSDSRPTVVDANEQEPMSMGAGYDASASDVFASVDPDQGAPITLQGLVLLDKDDAQAQEQQKSWSRLRPVERLPTILSTSDIVKQGSDGVEMTSLPQRSSTVMYGAKDGVSEEQDEPESKHEHQIEGLNKSLKFEKPEERRQYQEALQQMKRNTAAQVRDLLAGRDAGRESVTWHSAQEIPWSSLSQVPIFGGKEGEEHQEEQSMKVDARNDAIKLQWGY